MNIASVTATTTAPNARDTQNRTRETAEDARSPDQLSPVASKPDEVAAETILAGQVAEISSSITPPLQARPANFDRPSVSEATIQENASLSIPEGGADKGGTGQGVTEAPSSDSSQADK